MNRVVLAVVWLSLVLGASCSSEPPPPPPPEPDILAPPTTDASRIPLPEPTSADLASNAIRADLVIAAEVLSVGQPPGRTGNPCAHQGVAYRVLEVFRGASAGEQVRVAHPVCLGRPLIDSLAVRLSPTHFGPGQKLVLFLQRDATGLVREADGAWVSEYVVLDERNGTLLDSAGVREAVRNAAKAAGSAPGAEGDPFGRGRRR
jgi:hypothetical protein